MSWNRWALMAPVLTSVFAAAYGCSSDDSGEGPGTNPIDNGGSSSGETASSSSGGTTGPRKPSPLPTHSASIALSPDDSRLVAANREAGTVSVFSIDWASGRPEPTKIAELAIGAEVSAVAIHPSGTFALALSRVDQKVVRIDDLGGTPKVGQSVKTGSEPTALALTPMGDQAWITNWVDGTVMVLDTEKMTMTRTIDLNATIAASGLLGSVLARPALSHPRSIAITNNGNNLDNDEKAYVTEFYAQTKVPLLADGSNADVAKVGVVYEISIKDPSVVKVIELPPMADMGFKDHKAGTAGCFPNQLLSINIQGSFGYVTSICASPRGPGGPFTGPAAANCPGGDADCPGALAGSCVNAKCTTNCTADAQCGANGGKCNTTTFVCAANMSNIKTTLAPAVTIIDLGAAKTIATVNLAKEFSTNFDSRGLADDGNRRMPLTPMDIGFVPGTVTAYVAAKGADAVFKIDFNATYEASTIDGVADPKAPFINLAPAGIDSSRMGRLPTGLAVAFKTHTQGSQLRYAFVNSENTRTVSVLDLEAQDLAGRSEGTPVVAQSSKVPDGAEFTRLEGERLFATGLGRWSLKGQAWMSCESCHVDGLSDNVTWYFPRGNRQPNSLDGLFNSKDPTDSRFHNWTAAQDEVSDHEMGAIRGSMGGIGAIVKNGALDPVNRIAIDKLGQAGLAGSSLKAADPTNPIPMVEACVIDDWSQVNAFFQNIRSPKRPSNLDAAKVTAGRALFEQGNCQGCHGGGKWTTSKVFYAPDPTNAVNNALKSKSWTDAVSTASFPSALLPATTLANQNMRYNGANGGLDSMICVLRPVGTYNVAEPAVGVAEFRQDMTTPGQGNEPDGKGFNPPSLLSMSVGAPYLHAGQVRTLEALFGSTFATHREALKAGFLAEGSPNRDADLAALIEFLLSIDEDAAPIAEPSLGPTGGSFCTQ